MGQDDPVDLLDQLEVLLLDVNVNLDNDQMCGMELLYSDPSSSDGSGSSLSSLRTYAEYAPRCSVQWGVKKNLHNKLQ